MNLRDKVISQKSNIPVETLTADYKNVSLSTAYVDANRQGKKEFTWQDSKTKTVKHFTKQGK